MQSSQDHGLDRSRLLQQLVGRLRVHYRASVLQAYVDNSKQAVDTLSMPPSSPAVVAVMELLDIPQIFQRDFSETTLNERLEHLMHTIQIEMIPLFLQDLGWLSLMTQRGTSLAQSLRSHYRGSLFTNSLDTKRQMMLDVEQQFLNLAGRRFDEAGQAVLRMLAARSGNVARGVDDVLALFRRVYAVLGCDLPPLLQPPTAIATAAGEVAAAATLDLRGDEVAEATVAAAEPTRPAIDPQAREEAATRLARELPNLRSAIGGLRRPWLRTNGANGWPDLAAVSRSLSKDFTDLAVNRNARELLIGVVSRLTALANGDGGIEEAATTLHQAMIRQSRLEAESLRLQSLTTANGIAYPSDLPSIPQIRLLIDQMQAKWSRFQRFITEHWGEAVATELRRVIERQHELSTSPTADG